MICGIKMRKNLNKKYNYPVLRCPKCGSVVIEDGLNKDVYKIFKCTNCNWSDGDENEI